MNSVLCFKNKTSAQKGSFGPDIRKNLQGGDPLPVTHKSCLQVRSTRALSDPAVGEYIAHPSHAQFLCPSVCLVATVKPRHWCFLLHPPIFWSSQTGVQATCDNPPLQKNKLFREKQSSSLFQGQIFSRACSRHLVCR